MAGVNIKGLSKQYTIGNHSFFAVKDINLSIADESFVSIVGKSGCGKTTMLRLLCGLVKQTEGFFDFTFQEGSDDKKQKRVGIVFQEPRLMPWLTVKENMLFPLIKEKDKVHQEELAKKYLHIMGLDKFKDAYPSQISVGMAQRVALGRTLCYNPDVILMDEPFAALDYFTRKNLQEEIIDLFLSHRKTIIFVTHNVEEAVFLSQRVVVMESGEIVRVLPIDLSYPRVGMSSKLVAIQEEVHRIITGNKQGNIKTG